MPPAPPATYAAERIMRVKHDYALLDMRRLEKVATLPSHPSVSPDEATQHIAKTTRSAICNILAKSDPSGPGIDEDDPVPGWTKVLYKCVCTSVNPVEPPTAALDAFVPDCFRPGRTPLSYDATGPAVFKMLLDFISGHFDRASKGDPFAKLHNFGVPSGVPFSGYLRAFRFLVTSTVREERRLSPSADMTIDLAR